jgi:hypothetical protein
MSALRPIPIVPPPGCVVTETAKAAEGRWTIPFDKIRFVKGRPQKVGGNVRLTTTVGGAPTPMSGTPRALHVWRDFLQNQYVSAGTFRKLYALDSSFALADITPYRATGTLGSNPFTTISGSASVSVAHTAHGTNPGDTVVFSGAAAFNNVSMNGTFIVQTVTDANDFVVTATSAANANGAGGGSAVAFSYEVPIGTETGAYGQGFGVGGYGLSTYGTARGSSTIFYEPRVWSLDHFGKVLLAAYNGGTLWSFDPTQGQPWPRAVATFGGVAMNAPSNIRAMFVTPERFVFALCDAMVVNVCSQGDPTSWTPATTNTAFARTLQEGTKLVGGKVLGPYQSLVWTDAALILFQYTGNQFVYNSSLAGRDCGLISPNAAVTVDGIAYWMGADNFYLYNGSVYPIPNVEDIRKYVFDALPIGQLGQPNLAFQCSAVYVAKYHEIWFFYPTIGDSNPTHYVIFHINDQCWSVGTFARASGTHFTQGDTAPLMAGTDGFIYQHDPVGDTFNDNGAPLAWTLTMNPLALEEGLARMDVEGIRFDFFQQAGDITATVSTFDNTSDPSVEDADTDTVPASSPGISDFRVAGRYIGLTLSSSDPNNTMRYGKPIAYAKAAGERR